MALFLFPCITLHVQLPPSPASDFNCLRCHVYSLLNPVVVPSPGSASDGSAPPPSSTTDITQSSGSALDLAPTPCLADFVILPSCFALDIISPLVSVERAVPSLALAVSSAPPQASWRIMLLPLLSLCPPLAKDIDFSCLPIVYTIAFFLLCLCLWFWPLLACVFK